jgi:uroporphyrinogen decarboxylase
MAAAKDKLGDKVALWGGVNGHLTIERGSPLDVRREAGSAMEILAPGGGFVLSPVDNVRPDTARAMDNSRVLIDEWRRLTGQ